MCTEDESILSRMIEYLRSEVPELRGLYLYGSRLDPAYVRPDSDWDLGLLTTWPPLDDLHRWKLQNALSDLAGAEVDLVDLQAADDVMRFQVIGYGERVFCADADFCGEFEMQVYSRYQYLEEERKGIIQDILERKSVYGR